MPPYFVCDAMFYVVNTGTSSERSSHPKKGTTVRKTPSLRWSWRSSRFPRVRISAQKEAPTASLTGSIGEPQLVDLVIHLIDSARWQMSVCSQSFGRLCALCRICFRITPRVPNRTVRFSQERHPWHPDASGYFLDYISFSARPQLAAHTSTPTLPVPNPSRKHVPSTMIASSEQCRRHVSGATSAISSFSDDGVVQSVLKELKRVGENQRARTKPPLVRMSLARRACFSFLLCVDSVKG